jgi:hypothetical protein
MERKRMKNLQEFTVSSKPLGVVTQIPNFLGYCLVNILILTWAGAAFSLPLVTLYSYTDTTLQSDAGVLV